MPDRTEHDPTSDEVDRHVDDQPAHDGLLDPEEIEPAAPVVTHDHYPGPPPSEDQAETQADTLDAEGATENAGARHPLSDERKA